MIALSIREASTDRALRTMRMYAELTDLFELRLDYVQNPDLVALLRCSYTVSKPVLVTNRHRMESGPEAAAGFQGSETDRIRYLQEALTHGAAYVDIEYNHFHQFSRSKDQRIILSYHDFEKTPDLEEIFGHISEKIVESTDVIKIATVANSFEDSIRMMQLISKESRRGSNVIGICMGEYGRITRVLGPLYGGFLTFAIVENLLYPPSGELGIHGANSLLHRASSLYLPEPEKLSARLLMEYSAALGLE